MNKTLLAAASLGAVISTDAGINNAEARIGASTSVSFNNSVMINNLALQAVIISSLGPTGSASDEPMSVAEVLQGPLANFRGCVFDLNLLRKEGDIGGRPDLLIMNAQNAGVEDHRDLEPAHLGLTEDQAEDLGACIREARKDDALISAFVAHEFGSDEQYEAVSQSLGHDNTFLYGDYEHCTTELSDLFYNNAVSREDVQAFQNCANDYWNWGEWTVAGLLGVCAVATAGLGVATVKVVFD